MLSKKHKSSIQGSSSSAPIESFFVQKFTPLEYKILAVEGTLAFHSVKHHFSYKSTDCTTNLISKIIDDSEIAKKLTSARTKTEAIVNNVLSPLIFTMIKSETENIPYISVATDGSNHGSTKLFPVLIQYFDCKKGVTTKMIKLGDLKNETAVTIATYLEETLRNFNLFEKCVAFSADNCNTNFGGINRKGNNNIYALLKQKTGRDIIGIGCPVHIVHNCGQHGFDALNIDLQTIVCKIYNYFSIYTIRTEELKTFCEFVETEYKQLLNHSKTRFLSLYPAII
jgi:hypothetical protein